MNGEYSATQQTGICVMKQTLSRDISSQVCTNICTQPQQATINLWRKAEKFLCEFKRDEAGVTAIEYALLGALIAVVIVTSVGLLGVQLNAVWTAVSDAVVDAVS
jgi:pilus assembly protein Flp/PilA